MLAAADLAMPIPLYAGGGAVISSGPIMAWAGERPLDHLTPDIYPDDDGAAEGLLYEDDGASLRTGGRAAAAPSTNAVLSAVAAYRCYASDVKAHTPPPRGRS